MNTALLHILSSYQQIDSSKPPEAITVHCNAAAYYLEHRKKLAIGILEFCVMLQRFQNFRPCNNL